MKDSIELPNRRQLLHRLGALGVGGTAAAVASAATPPGLGGVLSPKNRAAGALPANAEMFQRAQPLLQAATTCTVTPTATEGPFYVDTGLIRNDITEGLAGLPMYVFFLVVQASNCTPVANIPVDLWHADADGNYSGVPQLGTNGQTFLRGVQLTDSNGFAWFETVFPGWYSGRTTHFHVKVHPTNNSVVTTQSYFEDSIPDVVYTNLMPYAARGPRNTNNAQDGIHDSRNDMVIMFDPSGALRLWAAMIIGLP